METKEIFPGIIREWDKKTGIVKVNGVMVDSISYERHLDESTQFGHSPAEHTIIIVYHAM